MCRNFFLGISGGVLTPLTPPWIRHCNTTCALQRLVKSHKHNNKINVRRLTVTESQDHTTVNNV